MRRLVLSAIVVLAGCESIPDPTPRDAGVGDAELIDSGSIVVDVDGSVVGFDATVSDGGSTDGEPTDGGPTDGGPTAGPDNADVFSRLVPTCAGCHQAGSRPYFASLSAFEVGLVGDRRFVVPGEPDDSELIHLLEGNGSRDFTQMPPAGASFVGLEAAGHTLITIAELRQWIVAMGTPPPPPPPTAPVDGVLVRRLTAEQIVRALYDHLGLEDADFWNTELSFGFYPAVGYGRADQYPVRSPDEPPGWGTNSPIRRPSIERFLALGGPDFGQQRARSQDVTATFLHTLGQTAQAHCRKAVTKTGNDAVLHHVSLADTDAASVRGNIEYLHLKLLGEPADATQVDALHQDIFAVYEAAADTTAAWTAVCAALIRDPRWFTY